MPHHPPFLEVFERSCAASAVRAGGPGGAGGTDGAGGTGGAGGAGGAGGRCIDFVVRHGERHVGVLDFKKKLKLAVQPFNDTASGYQVA